MNLKTILVFVSALLLVACNSQSQIKASKNISSEKTITNSTIQYDSGDVVTKGFVDQSGYLWFTTTKEGVFRYDGESFTNYTVKDGLCANQVWSIMQDKDGIIWFSTASGMCRYDGQTFRNIPIPQYDIKTEWLEECYPIVNPNAVLCMIQDQNGDFWIGSNGAGAYHYDGESFTSLLMERGKLMPDSLHHNVVLSIIEDAQGHIWFTSFSHGGISRFDGKDFTHFGIQEGIGDDMIATVYMTKNKDLWFGTRGGGMSRFDGEEFTMISEQEGRCSNNMATMLEDSKGRFWVSSYTGGGICMTNGVNFTPFVMPGSDNLVDVKCITEDKDGNIWFGGRYGILWRYDGVELVDFTRKGR